MSHVSAHEARARRLFVPSNGGPDRMSEARASYMRDAWDHRDIDEHMRVFAILREAAQRIRDLAPSCLKPDVLNDVAAVIEVEAAWPLTSEAIDWNDDRDARRDGDQHDFNRMCRSE